MNRSITFLIVGAFCVSLACCAPKPVEESVLSSYDTADFLDSIVSPYSWQDELKAEIPLLGHRNWIVVADMAYPLQNQAGIRTIYVDAPYRDILSFVYDEIHQAPHVKANVYLDKELSYLDDNDAKGVEDLREFMNELFGDKAIPVLHDKLIARLDEVSRMFNVVIVKSSLTIPYTTTFFELDCDYWTAKKEKSLRTKMNK